MTAILTRPAPKPTSRPKPGPGHRVIVPEPDAFAPWATVLEHCYGTRRLQWVMSAEGALVPVPVADDGAAARPRRRPGGRFATLVRR